MIKNNNFATLYNYNFISKLAHAHSCLWLVTKFNMTNIYYKKKKKKTTTSNGNVSRSGIHITKLTLYRYHNDTITFIAHVSFLNTKTILLRRILIDTFIQCIHVDKTLVCNHIIICIDHLKENIFSVQYNTISIVLYCIFAVVLMIYLEPTISNLNLCAKTTNFAKLLTIFTF